MLRNWQNNEEEAKLQEVDCIKEGNAKSRGKIDKSTFQIELAIFTPIEDKRRLANWRR